MNTEWQQHTGSGLGKALGFRKAMDWNFPPQMGIQLGDPSFFHGFEVRALKKNFARTGFVFACHSVWNFAG